MYHIPEIKILRRGLFTLCLIIAIAPLADCKSEKKTDLQGAAVTALSGKVTVVNTKGQSSELKTTDLLTKAALVLPGYSIKTGAKSRVDLSFTSGARLRLAENTSVRLTKTQVLSGKNFSRVLLHLTGGKVYAAPSKLSKKSYFRIKTPTAIASVRGTEFLIKQAAGKAEILVKEGKVEVTDENVPELPNAPEAPDAPTTDPEKDKPQPEPPVVVEEDKKAEVDDNGEVVVKPQTDEDKKELDDISKGIENITQEVLEKVENIVKEVEEHQKLIEDTYEEHKNKIEGEYEKKDAEIKDKYDTKDAEIKDKYDEAAGKNKEALEKSEAAGKKALEEQKEKSKGRVKSQEEKNKDLIRQQEEKNRKMMEEMNKKVP